MSSELRFDGRVVLVTGAGNGLGRSHALLFARRGAKVVVNDLGGGRHGEGRSSAAANAVVDEIKAFGGEAVANADSVEDGDKIVQTALDAYGQLDVVINNAGILRDTSFPKMTEADWELIYRVHVLGAYRVTKAAWEHMRTQGYGRVIFTSSAAGLYGNFGQANYSTAKMGLVGLSQTLALEGAKRNIQVNVIAPVAGSRLTETIMPPEITAALKPEYVSPLVAWLCHESCEETGAVFEVGGGFHGKLRWERTVGRTFPVGRDLAPEQVRAAWGDITDFTKTTHPENVNAALQTVLANLEKPSKGGNEFINVDEALGATVDGIESTYDARDLTLYALGVGAGRNPLDAHDLKFVYERHADGFFALPTYGVIPGINAILERAAKGETAPGLHYGFERILHGEQTTELLRPLPAPAPGEVVTLIHKVTVKDIFDKGKNAVVVFRVESRDKTTGTPLIVNDISMVIRGAGGWGGDRGGAGESHTPPERAPDAVTIEKVDESQALLYRLSGDWNPLHVDPAFAGAFGFDKPILHGLCTFGYVGRAVVANFCGGDPRLFKKIKVRFADSVFPGETLKTEMWKEGQRVILRASVIERDKVVLTAAAVDLHSEVPKDESATAPASSSSGASIGSASTGPVSADVFAALKVFAGREPAAMTKAGFVYRFTLKDPASVWTLDLKGGDVAAGAAAKADCTLDMLDADFMAMVAGKADPQKLFSTGKLKIGGNIMASQKLEVLMKLDKTLVEQATAARTGGASSASSSASMASAVSALTPDPSPRGRVEAAGGGERVSSPSSSARVIEALRARLHGDAALAGGVGVVVALVVKEPDAAFTLDLSAGAGCVADGAPAAAAATLTLSDADLLALAAGTETLRGLYQHGRLRVDGDVGVVHRLTFMQQLL